jgi:sugar phosphate isomerase/epimerase
LGGARDCLAPPTRDNPRVRSLVYAMDTSFYNRLGAYDFDVRREMLAELGYDATYLTLWSETAWGDVPRLARVCERFGLGVAAVYANLDVGAGQDHEANGRIERLLHDLEGCTTVELAVTNAAHAPSDPLGDAACLKWLGRLLPIAEEHGITLALYPHVGHWLEKLQDAARLCATVQHPNLGMVFTGFHWYAVDGRDLHGRLRPASPYLRLANLCGSRRGAGGPSRLDRVARLRRTRQLRGTRRSEGGGFRRADRRSGLLGRG